MNIPAKYLDLVESRKLRPHYARRLFGIQIAVVAAVIGAWPAWSQSVTATTAKNSPQPPVDVAKLTGVPGDFLLYRFFFAHVGSLDAFADSIQSNTFPAKVAGKTPASVSTVQVFHPATIPPPAAYPPATTGSLASAATAVHDGSDARHRIKTSAGLTDAEEALVKTVAAKCLADLAAFDKTGFATAKAIARKYPANVKLSLADQAQVKQLEDRREKIVTDSVAQLKAAMGAKRFAAFHAFVVGSETPNIRHRELPVVRTK